MVYIQGRYHQDKIIIKSETFLSALQEFNDKDFLMASLAASALVTMADGVISAKEKQKMMLFIDGYEQLALTSMDVDCITSHNF